MYGTSIGSVIGTQSWFFYSAADMHSLFFQTVFAATAATIVSGAIAERTKFTTYLIFSLMTYLFIQFLVAGFGMLEDGLRKWDLLICRFKCSTLCRWLGISSRCFSRTKNWKV
jgi:ammonia channel protein AmtB